MRKHLRWLIVVAVVFVTAAPASADHADNDYFKTASEADVWGLGPASACWPDEWDTALGETTSDNAKGRIDVARDEWAALDYNGSNITVTEDCGGFDFQQELLDVNLNQGLFCNQVGAVGGMPTTNSYQYEDLGFLEFETFSTIYAITIACDTNDNGLLDWFVTAFNSEFENNIKFSGTPNDNDPIGFASLMVHEFGHAIGWDGEMGDPCPSNGNIETMCGGETGWLGGFRYHWAGSNSTGEAFESLEAHESQETNVAY